MVSWEVANSHSKLAWTSILINNFLLVLISRTLYKQSFLPLHWTLDFSNLPITQSKVVSVPSVEHCNITSIFLNFPTILKIFFVFLEGWKIQNSRCKTYSISKITVPRFCSDLTRNLEFPWQGARIIVTSLSGFNHFLQYPWLF